MADPRMPQPIEPSEFFFQLETPQGVRAIHVGQSKTVRRDAYDFLVVRIPNHDAWYVVPRKALGTRASAHFTPHNPKGKGQYEPYRDGEGCFSSEA